MQVSTAIGEMTQALLDGAYEKPLWASFLSLLARETGADFVVLLCQPPGWKQDDCLQLVSGDMRVEDSNELYRRYFVDRNPTASELMQEGRAYSLEELIALDRGEHEAFYADLVTTHRVTDLRQMRVREAGGVDARLTIVSLSRSFDVQTDRLLCALAPVLRSVLRNYIVLERERFTASLAEEAIRRLQFGWIALDAGGGIVDSDPVGEMLLRESGVVGRTPRGRLTIADRAAERTLLATIRTMASQLEASPKAVSLSSDPWFDMLLVPAPHRLLGPIGKPVIVAYVHGDSWGTADRCEQLMDLFRLTRSEARLALEICRGRSIAEAACQLDLQVETVRGYSKRIFAKTGARGQTDLVRILMGSVLALTPDGRIGAPRPASR
ncbi:MULTISPECIES: helix-turn-helix transcriptional regulator [unclassified Novosphingobium]|nr:MULTISPECIES: helix-turn-helix transcriptional regulator [unclassified Novosphingobium]KPH66768.1 hypothetical protein ADT71_04425 [Novosphingobium sp. ST904]MPS68154.1 helix-turn-helix transcriptional regulator [Novosphingobium sp.]TCM25789.1 DNA-binding CsgD family transcriptional regulator [Novosphingobium sp. ST904]WRT95272.1 helix-turn-helix transcriptional regulator [Novosphingobium sp. RL4]